ncbi:hypothetical protein AB4Z01_32815 [Inquilinus sp. YAF38]|uniref:hypothetical protein n=1 Tax=Inquilinus sp. YAF38 TaxID=3233084 RepID=UPI003F90EBA5
MIRLPGFWRRHFLAVELVLALSLAAAFAFWYTASGGAVVTDAVLQGNRAAFYGTTASIFGSLLGFVITATSIVLGFSTSDRISVVRESAEYPKLWKIFSATIRTLALATIVALTCLLFDRDTSSSRWLVVFLAYAVLLSLLRIGRTIWALEQIIFLVTRPAPK